MSRQLADEPARTSNSTSAPRAIDRVDFGPSCSSGQLGARARHDAGPDEGLAIAARPTWPNGLPARRDGRRRGSPSGGPPRPGATLESDSPQGVMRRRAPTVPW